MNKLYKNLSLFNDAKAVCKGRILQRMWNKWILKFTRKLMK